MTAGALELLARCVLAFTGFAGAAALGAAWLERPVLDAARRLGPSTRSLALFGWSALPFTAAAVLVAVALWPAAGAPLGIAEDHCLDHPGHLHLCLRHLPTHGPGVSGVAGLTGLGLAALALGLFALRSLRLARSVLGLRRRDLEPGVGLVRAREPFAVTVGWLRPRVLLSSALTRALTPEQLRVVVAHERAHATRRDALWTSAARVLSTLHLPRVRRRALEELLLANELACDEAAAVACGDRLLVAETLVAAERAASGVLAPAPHPAIAGADVRTRVEHLLDGPTHSVAGLLPRPWLVAGILAAILAALASAAPHVHHWTETLLDTLPH